MLHCTLVDDGIVNKRIPSIIKNKFQVIYPYTETFMYLES